MPTIVPAVSPEQIESVETGFPTPERKVFELRFAVAVEGNEFAVEHRRPGTELRLGSP
jgi:hypothetical protein